MAIHSIAAACLRGNPGPGGFEGGLTNQKYRGMTGASKVAATRDLTALAELGLLVRRGEGRATRYELDWARAAS